MENKLAITIVALMVVALAAPGVMAADYTTTVLTAQSTTVAVGSGGVDFGDLPQGNFNTLTSSLNLTNGGGWPAAVTAKFTTNDNTTWGLFNGSVGLPGNNFELGTTGYLKPLNFDAADAVGLTADNNVPANDFVLYDAKLTVPSSQAAGAYSGTVELMFANA